MSYFMNQKDGVIIYQQRKAQNFETPRHQLLGLGSISIETFNESLK
jgi:hypothetical protein